MTELSDPTGRAVQPAHPHRVRIGVVKPIRIDGHVADGERPWHERQAEIDELVESLGAPLAKPEDEEDDDA